VLENSKMMKNRKYVDPKEELTRHFDGLDLYMFISGLPVAGITKNQADKYFEQFGLDDNLLSSKLNKRYKQVLQFANETKQC
jgi:hypothetical protein